MQNANQKFSTLEIHLAAYLLYRGIPITLESASGRIIFTASSSDILYSLTTAYNSNDSVPILDYVGTLRALKAKMYAMREIRNG